MKLIWLYISILFALYSSFLAAQNLERVVYQPIVTSGFYQNSAPVDMAFSEKYGLFTVGGFNIWGIKTARVAKLSESNDMPDLKFPRIYDGVTDVIEDGKGGWFVAGTELKTFNEGNAYKDDFYYQGVVHILPDYSIDPNFKLYFQYGSQQINKMALWKNTLYVVGTFSYQQTSLLAFNAETGAALSAPKVSASSANHCLIYGNTLYLAGSNITAVNGTAINRSIIAIDLPSGTLKNWGNFTNQQSGGSGNFWGATQNIVAQNGKIIIGLTEFVFQGSTTYSIAAFDTLTASQPLWQKVVTDSRAICANQSGIYYAGQITTQPNTQQGFVGALNLSDGNPITTLNLQNYAFKYTQGQAGINYIACTQNTLFVSGVFDQVNTTDQSSMAAIDLTTGTLKNWKPDPVIGTQIILRVANGSLMAVGGDYYKAKKTIHIALLNPITQEPVNKNFDFLPYNPTGNAFTGYGSSFSTVAVRGDTLWIGGTKGNGHFVGAYNLITGDSLNQRPITFTGLYPSRLVAVDSVVYTYGNFTAVNGQTRRHLAAISAKGNLLPFSITAEPYSSYSWDCIKDFKVVGDLIYLAGTFTSINGVPRKYLACVNRWTGQLTNWNPDPDQAISKIDIVDQSIYFSGYQQRIGTTTFQGYNTNNFLIDRFTGRVTRAWGNAGIATNFIVKDKYLFLGMGWGPFTTVCGSGGGFMYYDFEYKRYGSPCIVRNAYSSVMADPSASRLLVAGSKIYVSFTNLTNSNLMTREQPLMQLTFPQGFFRDEITYFPKQANNAGSATVNFYGYQLGAGTKVRLLKNGEIPISSPDSLVRYPEPYRVEVVFNLRNKTTGSWDIELITGKGERILLPNGFTISPPLPPTFRTRINAPVAVRPGAPSRITIVVSNRGESDSHAVPIYITIPPGATAEIPTGQPVPNLTDGLQLLPTEISPGGEQAVAVAVPSIGASETIEIPLIVRPGTGTEPIQVQAYPGEPLVEDPYFDEQGHLTPKSKECRDEIVEAVVNAVGIFVPAVDCAKAIYDEYKVFSGQAGLKDLIGITAQGLIGCSETFLTKKIQTLAAVGKGIFKAAKFLADGLSAEQALANVLEIPSDCFTPDRKHAAGATIPVVASMDPNDKLGPVGAGPLRYISADSPINYLIRFENYASATAAAQYVLILDTLDRNKFDFSTFQFGYFNVADTTFESSPGRKHYLRDWDQRPATNLILRMEADFDDSTGIFRATYTTLDPQTMQRTEDPIIGFLPPNTTAPEGEGGVLFTIAPKANLPHSTTLTNKASIYFDYNAPIPTPPWSNVLDKVSPSSQVMALAETVDDSVFTVSWSGNDIGSGAKLYDLYVATNTGGYRPLVRNTPYTSFTIVGQPDSTYRFYTVAIDSVGNEELAPITFDAITTVRYSDRVDLALSLHTNNRIVRIGEPVTYTLRLRNDSPANPNKTVDVTWENRLPPNLQFISGQSITYSNGILTGNASQLAGQSDALFTFQATPTVAGVYQNAAQITASTKLDPDSRPGSGTGDGEDDSATIDIRTTESAGNVFSSPNPNQLPLPSVQPNQPPADPTKADLSLQMQVSSLTPRINEVVTYTLTVSNRGGATGTSIQLANLLPSGLEFIAGNGWTLNDNTIQYTISSVSANTSVSVSFQARVRIQGNLVNQAQIMNCAVADPDSTPGNGYTNGEDDTAQLTIRSQ